MLGNISEKNEKLLDLSWREIAVFAPLIACAFWIGLRPQLFLDVVDRRWHRLLRARAAGLLRGAQAAESALRSASPTASLR